MKYRDRPKEDVIDGLKEIFRLPLEDAEDLYSEVELSQTSQETSEVLSERWMFDPHLAEGRQEAGLVYFDNGAILTLEGMRAKIFLPQKRKYENIKHIFFFDEEELVYREDPDADNEWCGLFYATQASSAQPKPGEPNEAVSLEEPPEERPEDQTEYWCIGLTKGLAKSLFARLYFTWAKGLRHFEPFIMDKEAGIYAFSIKWEVD